MINDCSNNMEGSSGNKVRIENNQIGTINMVVHNSNNSNIFSNAIKHSSVWFEISDSIFSFRGRKNELSKLDCLYENSKIVAVCGMGGVGKTELSRYYANRNKEKYNGNAALIHAETYENLVQSFRALATDLQITNCENRAINSVVQDVYRHFNESSVLIVFDNAENRRSIQNFLPTASMQQVADIHILITSQFTEWGSDIPSLPLTQLSLKSSLELVASVVGCEHFERIVENQWVQLAEICNCVPLALQIAVGYVKERLSMNSRCSISDYIERLQEKDGYLEEELPTGSPHSYAKTIYASLRYTLDKIERSSCQKSKQALVLINMCAYLDADNITDYLLLRFPVINNSNDNLEEALSVLKKFSLIIGREEKKHYSLIRVHRLVQQFLRYDQEKNGTVLQFYELALNFVTSNIKSYRLHCISVLQHTSSLKLLLQSLKPTERQSTIRLKDRLVRIFKSEKLSKVQLYIKKRKLLYISSEALLYKTMNLLIEYGADTNSIHKDEQFQGTPLAFLLETLDTSTIPEMDTAEKCIRLLIQHSADLNVTNCLNRNVLHLAAWWKNFKLTKFILSKNKEAVNAKDISGCTPLHLVCKEQILDEEEMRQAKECIRCLIENGADVNAKNKDSRTALHNTALWQNWQLTELLIDDYKVDSNILDKWKNTPLMVISKYSDAFKTSEEIDRAKRTIQSLVQRKARADIQNRDGVNVLHLVAEKRCVSLIEYLIDEHCLDVHVSDVNGWTALHNLTLRYCSEKNLEIVKQCMSSLVKRGADINAKDLEGHNVLSHAAKKCSWCLVEHLLNDYEMDTNVQDNKGLTPLMLSFSRGVYDISDQKRRLATMKVLISRNARVDLRCSEGLTVLHYAALKPAGKMSPVLEYLIDECCVNPNDKDKKGATPLHHIAAKRTFGEDERENVVKCVNVLLKRGARTDLTDNKGKTAAQCVTETQNDFLLQYLK